MIFGLLIMILLALLLIGLIALWQFNRDRSLQLAQRHLLTQALSDAEPDGDMADPALMRRVLDIDQSQQVSDQVSVKHLPILGFIFLICFLGIGVHLISPQRIFQDYGYEFAKKFWAKTLAEDPSALPAEAVAAVMRTQKEKNAKDARFWLYLAQIETMADQPYAATKAFERARTLQGDQFIAFAEWGEALTLVAKGKPTEAALGAFDEAIKRTPNEPRAHYYLGRFAYDRGQFDEASRHYKTTLMALSRDDPRRQWIETALTEVNEAKSKGDESRAMIQSMVASLAQKLNETPDNPEGWARLLRSLDILEDEAGLTKAKGQLDQIYKDRPQLKDQIIKQSQAAVGAETMSTAQTTPSGGQGSR